MRLGVALSVGDIGGEPREAVRECRDPKDDKYLALAARQKGRRDR